MLFNSHAFLFIFLPLTLLGYFWIGRRNATLAPGFLALASVIFYGCWDPRFVPLLLLSIVCNYFLGRLITDAPSSHRKRWLVFAIAANLVVLIYFKYAGFLLSSVNQLAGSRHSLGEIVLPLGISFFTFTQIAFLVDCYQGKVREYRFTHYCLFVTFFPHLVAGPVLHHGEMMPQFADAASYRPRITCIELGLTLFTAGLFKKMVLADNIAAFVSPAFSSLEPLSFFDAWGAALSYTFQLYFDFSGYSDMAIGLAYLFGVRFPLNFNSPYKSANITDFWRRWHMTLSRFLRDYLYIALGGNRKGKALRYVNLMLTMVLGGLWHGAGWTFVVWGALHGVFLVTHQAWRSIRERFLPASVFAGRGYHLVCVLLTFLAVVVGWVFFRAPSFAIALNVLSGMAGLHGVAIPESIVNTFPSLKALLADVGVSFGLGGGERFVAMYSWIAVLALISFFAPNSQQWCAASQYAQELRTQTGNRFWPAGWIWRPRLQWSVISGLGLVLCLLSLSKVSSFLYFQF